MAKIQISKWRHTDGCIDYELTLEGEPFYILKAVIELGGLTLDGYSYQDWRREASEEKKDG